MEEHARPEAVEGAGAYGGDPRFAVVAATVQVVHARGTVVGAGFVVAPDTVVTCAHVVAAAGSGPGREVEVVFPHLPRSPRVRAEVLPEGWRDPAAQDIAVLRLRDVLPYGVRELPLGSAAGCRGHRVSSFGYPGQALPGGHFGYGRAADVLPAGDEIGRLLQLTDANDLARGFSGGPVVDEVTGLVIGMVSALTAPDEQLRGQGVVYVTPSEVLREVWPGLVEHEVCPYRGLEPFTEEHADWFFGRRAAVEQVLAELGGQRRALLLLGPSGAGKSSLVQAGVLPALAAGELPGSDRWRSVVARPGQDLLAELETAGLPGAATDGVVAASRRLLAEDPSAERLVLVVDQFEEALVQHTPDDHLTGRHRTAVEQLAQAIAAHEPVTVVLVMRDDFFPRLAALAPQLLGAAPGVLTVPARLGRPDLEAIITEPARALGLRVEDGLTERIVTDVLAATSSGPRERNAPATVLPLLELTLSQLWERRVDGTLTHRAYQRVGGVTGSLATWCDAAMNRLPEDRRATARRMLTALVRPADESRSVPPTRQRLALADLRVLAGEAAGHVPGARPGGEADEVLRVLTEHRIVITGNASRLHEPGTEPVAELIHDALISEWRDLRDWVAADHRFQVWLRRVLDQHTLWLEHQDTGDLLDGTDLADGLEWAGLRGLPAPVHTFLTLSRERRDSLRRRKRRTRVFLVTLVVLALIAGTVAYVQQRNAGRAQEQAESQRLRAEAQRLRADSRQLAARSAALLATDPDLASLLAVAAYRTSPTDEAVTSLHAAAAEPLSLLRTAGTGEIDAAAFHPDGRTLATGSKDGRVRLWDTDTGDVRSALTGHTAAVTSVRHSPDGRTLATGARDDTVRLWDAGSGRTRAVLRGHTNTPEPAEFSPDGALLATHAGNDMVVRLWRTADGTLAHRLPGHAGGAVHAVFSPDGRTLATTAQDRTVRLWDVTTGALLRRMTVLPAQTWAGFGRDGKTLITIGSEIRFWDTATGRLRRSVKAHEHLVQAVVFSSDGSTVATNDGHVRLWDVETGELRHALSHTTVVSDLSFSPDGRTFATGSNDGIVRVWDVASGQLRRMLKGHTGVPEGLAFSPDGAMLTSGGTDGTLRFWDIAGGRARSAAARHGHRVGSVAFSADGRTLASGSHDNTARLWEVATGKALHTLEPGGMVLRVAFSPRAPVLATASGRGVQLWDPATGKQEAVIDGGGLITDLVFSPDGRTLATSSPVRLWDVGKRARLRTFTGPGNATLSVAYGPGGETLVAGDYDNVLWRWDAASGAVRASSAGPSGRPGRAAAFSPDAGTVAYTPADDSVVLWDAAGGKVLRTLRGHDSTVTTVAFSPDGRTLVSGGNDQSVRLWDVATGTQRALLTGAGSAVSSVAFSRDGRTLAAGTSDGSVLWWDVALPQRAEAIDKICRALHRDLTPQERATHLPRPDTTPVCPAGR